MREKELTVQQAKQAHFNNDNINLVPVLLKLLCRCVRRNWPCGKLSRRISTMVYFTGASIDETAAQMHEKELAMRQAKQAHFNNDNNKLVPVLLKLLRRCVRRSWPCGKPSRRISTMVYFTGASIDETAAQMREKELTMRQAKQAHLNDGLINWCQYC